MFESPKLHHKFNGLDKADSCQRTVSAQIGHKKTKAPAPGRAYPRAPASASVAYAKRKSMPRSAIATISAALLLISFMAPSEAAALRHRAPGVQDGPLSRKPPQALTLGQKPGKFNPPAPSTAPGRGLGGGPDFSFSGPYVGLKYVPNV